MPQTDAWDLFKAMDALHGCVTCIGHMVNARCTGWSYIGHICSAQMAEDDEVGADPRGMLTVRNVCMEAMGRINSPST